MSIIAKKTEQNIFAPFTPEAALQKEDRRISVVIIIIFQLFTFSGPTFFLSDTFCL
jgi:hypothetical protein